MECMVGSINLVKHKGRKKGLGNDLPSFALLDIWLGQREKSIETHSRNWRA